MFPACRKVHRKHNSWCIGILLRWHQGPHGCCRGGHGVRIDCLCTSAALLEKYRFRCKYSNYNPNCQMILKNKEQKDKKSPRCCGDMLIPTYFSSKWLNLTARNQRKVSLWRGRGGFYYSPPIIENHRYLSVWKTVPSEARVTRDEVSGDKNTTMTVWKTVPNHA